MKLTASAEALTSSELCGNEIVETPQQGRKDTVIKELLVEVCGAPHPFQGRGEGVWGAASLPARGPDLGCRKGLQGPRWRSPAHLSPVPRQPQRVHRPGVGLLLPRSTDPLSAPGSGSSGGQPCREGGLPERGALQAWSQWGLGLWGAPAALWACREGVPLPQGSCWQLSGERRRTRVLGCVSRLGGSVAEAGAEPGFRPLHAPNLPGGCSGKCRHHPGERAVPAGTWAAPCVHPGITPSPWPSLRAAGRGGEGGRLQLPALHRG